MISITRNVGLTKSGTRNVTNAQRKRSVSFLVSTALLTVGTIALAVGAIAWRIPAPEPVKVIAAVGAVLPATSAFDAGVTLFANVPDHRNPPVPRAFGCRVFIAGGAPVEILTEPIPDLVGSRVVDGAALTGVIDLSHPAQGAKMVCDGPAAMASPSLWVLPSKVGPSDQPLAIIVAALFLLGLGALVHPRTRSI
jgi:hypothetical protein